MSKQLFIDNSRLIKKHFQNMRIFLLFALLTLLSYQDIAAQRLPVQLTGVVMSSDSIQPVFYATIRVPGTNRGTISDLNGYFSFVVAAGDEVVFSAVGYQKQKVRIPDGFKHDSYSIIQMMERDTILLNEAVVYPWPKPEEFKEAFLTLEVPDDDYQRAKRNLARETLAEIGEVMAMDGGENYNYRARTYSQNLYTAGQMQRQRIFEPLAWVEFIKALKRGDFKKKNN
ncbi:MAG: carboxypeptidase-like regulatory domain-containing protein [Chitinophagales bacterium]